jgi:hypothetical protein
MAPKNITFKELQAKNTIHDGFLFYKPFIDLGFPKLLKFLMCKWIFSQKSEKAKYTVI